MGGRQTKLAAAERPKGKPGKKSAQRQKQEPLEASKLVDRALVQLDAELDHLQHLREVTERTLASGEATPALIRESTGVSRALVQVSGEIRQIERQARQMADAMSPEERDELVFEYVRALPVGRRGALRDLLRELDGLDGPGNSKGLLS